MNHDINILQIIDSFALGGAERVSINYANNLAEYDNINSFICSTRENGALLKFINTNVDILHLNKTSTFDIKAIYKLIKYVKIHNIHILHAHSSSFFLASIVKLFTKTKIVWHIHNGNMLKTNKVKLLIMKFFSYSFDHIFTVNSNLQSWAKDTFHTNNISYIKNYPQETVMDTATTLQGDDGKRIVCLANLREQKDHLVLLHAFKLVLERGFYEWHLLLVGNDYDDLYSKSLKEFIKRNTLEENIHILGAKDDSFTILKKSSIGVISSQTEGLPMALLEYGLASLAVISTDVGQCSDVLGHGKYGLIVEPKNVQKLASSLELLMSSDIKRDEYALAFHQHIEQNYSKESVMKKIIEIYKGILNDR